MTKFTINISLELNETDTLIRYFDLNKFLSLIKKEELYLAIADDFPDIFEGEYMNVVGIYFHQWMVNHKIQRKSYVKM